MTIEQFSKATHYVQKTMVKFHGTLLMEKNAGEQTSKLYQINGFYVEVVYAFTPYSTPLIHWYTFEQIDEFLPLVDITAIHDLLE